jgi:hypothetical protein
MNRHFLSARSKLSPAALAGWGCVLVTICVGAGTALSHSKTGAAVRSQAAPSPRAALEPAKRLDPFRYFRSGQCRADVRTVGEVIHYLLEPEGDSGATSHATTLTNGSAVIQQQPGKEIRHKI